jgi:hypothetical protein
MVQILVLAHFHTILLGFTDVVHSVISSVPVNNDVSMVISGITRCRVLSWGFVYVSS